eukprot:313272_1
MNGLFVLMKHFRYGYDDHDYNLFGICGECGRESTLGSNNSDTDIYFCIDCWGTFTLVDILDLMNFVAENNWIRNCCVKQIECLNKDKVWEEAKQYVKLWKDNNNKNSDSD